MFNQVLPLVLIGLVACAPQKGNDPNYPSTTTILPDQTIKNHPMLQQQSHNMQQTPMQPNYQGQQFGYPGHLGHQGNVGQPLLMGQQQHHGQAMLPQQAGMPMSPGQFNPSVLRGGMNTEPTDNLSGSVTPGAPIDQTSAAIQPVNLPTQNLPNSVEMASTGQAQSQPTPPVLTTQTLLTHQPVLTMHPIISHHQILAQPIVAGTPTNQMQPLLTGQQQWLNQQLPTGHYPNNYQFFNQHAKQQPYFTPTYSGVYGYPYGSGSGYPYRQSYPSYGYPSSGHPSYGQGYANPTYGYGDYGIGY
jgi:hypothetical protein